MKIIVRRRVVNLEGELQAHINIHQVHRLTRHQVRRKLRNYHGRANLLLRMHYPRCLSGRRYRGADQFVTYQFN